MKTAGLILAAGASRRLGRPKQLAIVGGELLLHRAIRCCREAGLAPVVVVLGANADEITAACDVRGATVLRNNDWAEGVASAVRTGIHYLGREPVDAAVLTTCDMPFVTATHLRALVDLAEREKTNVASATERWRGVPACFLRDSFAGLLALQGDSGARKLLMGAPSVPLENACDVDTLEDMQNAQTEFEQQQRMRDADSLRE